MGVFPVEKTVLISWISALFKPVTLFYGATLYTIGIGDRMRTTPTAIVLALLLTVLLSPHIAWGANVQQNAEITPITAAFLKLYADPNPEVSLGAMLMSAHAGFPHPEPLIAYIKSHRSKNEQEPERTIKNYALAWLQWGNNEQDNLTFVVEFPETEEQFGKLMHLEQTVKSPPISYLLEALLTLAYSGGEDESTKEALKKKDILSKNVGTGWIGAQLSSFEELGY